MSAKFQISAFSSLVAVGSVFNLKFSYKNDNELGDQTDNYAVVFC